MFGMGTGGTSPSLPPVDFRPVSFAFRLLDSDLRVAFATLTTAQIGFNTSDLTIDLIVSFSFALLSLRSQRFVISSA